MSFASSQVHYADPSESVDFQPEPRSLSNHKREEFNSNTSSITATQLINDTFIIEDETNLNPNSRKKFTNLYSSSHERRFNTCGNLPGEKIKSDIEDMEEEATQLATQPVAEIHALGKNKSMSYEDEADVICILRPASRAAHTVVELVAKTTPQHILQNNEIERNLEDENSFHSGNPPVPPADDLQVSEGLTPNDLSSQTTNLCYANGVQPPTCQRTLDIALRLSSRIRDPCLGFTFGRSSQKCDIVFETQSEKKRVSMRHFRIYLNENGIIMLQDMSTNGTYVEDKLLKADPSTGIHKSHMLQLGATIELITNRVEDNIKFVISIPTRDHAGDKWSERLGNYIAFIAQANRQAEAVKRAKRAGNDLAVPVVPVNPFPDALSPRSEKIVAKMSGLASLASGSERYHFGMHWNGGETYNVIGYLGKGAFANVYQLATKLEGSIYAVKELEKRNLIKNGTMNFKVHSELEIMKNLRHPHIIEYVGYHDTIRYLYIIMEYSSGGDLSQYMNTIGMMPERLCQSVARQLCHALAYLHQCGITHRDIKPENLLISSNNPLTIKLSDFGLSKWIKKDDDTNLKTFCGTLLYCAPEVYPEYERIKKGLPRKRRRLSEPVSTVPYSSAVDAWSLGAVLFHLLCTKPPYTGSSEDRGAIMLETIMTTQLSLDPLLQAGTSKEGVDFLQRLLTVSPEKRATAAQSLDHEWISHINDIATMRPPPIVSTRTEPGLANIEEGDENLDASRLSLYEQRHGETDYSDEGEEGLEVDEITGGHHQSKRLKSHRAGALQEQESFASVSALKYPTLPTVGNDNGVPLQRQSSARLFGEIGTSALRSSGVLGQNAQTALEIAGEGSCVNGSEGESYDQSENMTDVEDPQFTAEDITQQHLHHPRNLPHPHPALSAPSLFGTEIQIGQLKMTSLGSGASIPSVGTAPVSPNTPGSPKSRLASPSQMSTNSGSKHTSQLDENTTTAQFTNRDQVANTSNESSFAKPNPIYGKLTTTPESSINLTIKLKQRVTSFGRDLRNTNVWPRSDDTRIPRIAFHLVFWRPGIERDIKNGLDWLTIPENELCTIIRTTTSKWIYVNDVVLKKGDDGSWFYGHMKNGDVITLYRESGEVIAFKCEFFRGTAKEGREKNGKFEIKREVEYFMKKKASGSSVVEQQGISGSGVVATTMKGISSAGNAATESESRGGGVGVGDGNKSGKSSVGAGEKGEKNGQQGSQAKTTKENSGATTKGNGTKS